MQKCMHEESVFKGKVHQSDQLEFLLFTDRIAQHRISSASVSEIFITLTSPVITANPWKPLWPSADLKENNNPVKKKKSGFSSKSMQNYKKTVKWTILFLWNGCVIAKVIQCCSCWLLQTEIDRYKSGLSCSLYSDSSNAERQHSPSQPQKGADSRTKSRVPGKVTFQWLQKE